MPKWLTLMLAGCSFAAGSARSEVAAASDIGSTARSSVDIAVYVVLLQPARRWSSEHGYSGDAAHMQLGPRAGGCFCETMPGRDGGPAGSVEQAYIAPGWQLRLPGALGRSSPRR